MAGSFCEFGGILATKYQDGSIKHGEKNEKKLAIWLIYSAN